MWKNEGTNATAGFEFTDGDVVLGIPRSILGATFLNMMLRELQNAVSLSGLPLNELDETQLFQAIRNMGHSTGDGKFTLKTLADPGWVMADDGAIGNAGSGASTRAHADTQPLFTLLWTNVLDAHAPVSGSRGISAAADFAAGKTISLPKQLGRALAAAGAGAGLTARALGSGAGAETHVLTIPEMPVHSHAILTGGSDTPPGAFVNDDNANDGGNGVTESAGGGLAHNNMQPSTFWHVMIKL